MKKIIEEMQKKGMKVAKPSDIFYVLMIESKGHEPLFCAFDRTTDTLGKGSYGTVYKAQIYDSKTGAPTDRSIAVKRTHDDSVDEKEQSKVLSITSSYIITYDTIPYNRTVFIPQELLGGAPLQNDNFETHPKIKDLTPRQILTLIVNVLEAFNEMHHNRLKTQKTAHFDIKGSNLLIDFITNPEDPSEIIEIRVRIIDFDLSRRMSEEKDDKEFEKIPLEFSYESGYHPPETQTKRGYVGGIKSDIWQLAAVISIILDHDHGLRCITEGDDSYQEDDDKRALYQLKYSADRFPAFAKLGFDKSTQQVITDFINRMRNETYDQRPDTDEVLKFFMKLKQLQLLENPTIKKAMTRDVQDDINLLKTELRLLADGHWRQIQLDKYSHQSGFWEQRFLGSKLIRKLKSLGVPRATLRKIEPLLEMKTQSPDIKRIPVLGLAPIQKGGAGLFSSSLPGEEKTQRIFYIVTLAGKTLDETWKFVEQGLLKRTVILKDPSKALTLLSYKKDHQILGFKCPSGATPGPEHIKKENIVKASVNGKIEDVSIEKTPKISVEPGL